MKDKKKIFIIAAVAVAAYLLLKKSATTQNVALGADWASLADRAGYRINEGLNILVNGIGEQARLKRQQSYDNLRDTKDNSKLYSNDMLLL